MVRRIEPEVAQNRSGRRRLAASFIGTGVGQSPGPGGGGETIAITGNELDVEATLEVYTRDLGSDADPALVVGHPDPEHGVGRGAVEGAAGGGWTLTEERDASLTTAARRALVDALVAPDGKITTITVDSGATGDGPGEHDTYAYGVLETASAGPSDSATAVARSIWEFHEHGGTVVSIGASTADDTTVAESTTSSVTVENDQELRVDVRLTVRPDPVGDTVFTDAGERALAASLVRPDSTIALAAVAIGAGEGPIDADDTELVAPIDTAGGDESEAVIAPGRVAIRGRWYRNEPDEQPVTIREIGVLDSAGDLVWRAEIRPVEKTSTLPLSAGMALTLRER